MARVFGIVILLALYIDFTLLSLCLEQRLNEEDSLFSFLIFEPARKS